MKFPRTSDLRRRDERTRRERFVILLVTRQGLPTELYDLATLEDATAWGVFRRVTLPLMAPILLLLLARDTIFSLQWTFIPALIVTDGGPPLYSTTYVPLFVYRNAFEYLRYGYAAGATLTMFLVTALVVWLQWRIVRCWRKGFVVGAMHRARGLPLPAAAQPLAFSRRLSVARPWGDAGTSGGTAKGSSFRRRIAC